MQLWLLLFLTFFFSDKSSGVKVEEELDLDEEETRTIAKRLGRGGVGSESQVVTGTFRFRRVVNGDGSSRLTSGRQTGGNTGWDVEGCYCNNGMRCSCSGNQNRVRMFVRTGGRGSGESQNLRDTECVCNNNECRGSCSNLNGCVCSASGTCWGAACSARIPNGVGLPQVAATGISAPIMTPMSAVSLVRNAVMSQPNIPLTINGQAENAGCTCNSIGCTGTGCAQLNGCFCVGQSCWGAACQSPLLSQQQQSLMQNPLAAQMLPQQQALAPTGLGGMMPFNGQMIPVVKGIPVRRLRGHRARGGGMMQHSNQRMRFAAAPRRMRKKKRGFQGKGMMYGGSDFVEYFQQPYQYAAIAVNGVPTAVPVAPVQPAYGPMLDRTSVDNSSKSDVGSIISLKKLQESMFRVFNKGKKISHKLDGDKSIHGKIPVHTNNTATTRQSVQKPPLFTETTRKVLKMNLRDVASLDKENELPHTGYGQKEDESEVDEDDDEENDEDDLEVSRSV